MLIKADIRREIAARDGDRESHMLLGADATAKSVL
jgi:hypothetical protein